MLPEILQHPPDDLDGPIGATVAMLFDIFGPEALLPTVTQCLLQTHDPTLIYGLGRGGQPWEWPLYEALATRAEDDVLRQKALRHLDSISLASSSHGAFEPRTGVGYRFRGYAHYFAARKAAGEARATGFQAAVADFDRAASMGDAAEGSVGKALTLIGLGRAAEAVAATDESIARDGDRSAAYLVRAEALVALGDAARADRDRARARELEVSEHEAYLATAEGLRERLGRLLTDIGSAIADRAKGRASAHFEAVVLRAYDDILRHHRDREPSYYLSRAMFLQYVGQDAKALDDLDAFLERQGGTYGYYLRGRFRRRPDQISRTPGGASRSHPSRAFASGRPAGK